MAAMASKFNFECVIQYNRNADCPPSWYSKFVISGSFSLLHCMRDLGLFISVVKYQKFFKNFAIDSLDRQEVNTMFSVHLLM